MLTVLACGLPKRFKNVLEIRIFNIKKFGVTICNHKVLFQFSFFSILLMATEHIMLQNIIKFLANQFNILVIYRSPVGFL